MTGLRTTAAIRRELDDAERELDRAFDQGNSRVAIAMRGRLDALRHELATAERQNGGTPAGGNDVSEEDSIWREVLSESGKR